MAAELFHPRDNVCVQIKLALMRHSLSLLCINLLSDKAIHITSKSVLTQFDTVYLEI